MEAAGLGKRAGEATIADCRGHRRGPPELQIYSRFAAAIATHTKVMTATREAKRQGLDPQKLLGHDEARTTKIYLRDRMVEVVEGPTMRRTA
jgi:hypothetical protein